jgi:hydrogenase nickel incorporation protein HypA/HybF
MHELIVVESIVSVVLRHAQMNHARRVTGVFLQVGELSDLQDQWIQHYFDFLSKNTIAAGAKLHIERVPVMFRCRQCNHEYTAQISEIDQALCPECSGEKATLISGAEYNVQNIEAIL